MALIEVVNGNPNGDPDAGGSLRMHPETGLGKLRMFVSIVKFRNYVDTTRAGVRGIRFTLKKAYLWIHTGRLLYIETGVAIPEDKKKAPTG